MEKRRRERINHSLETLRLLLLENTDDEVREGQIVEQIKFRCDLIANSRTELVMFSTSSSHLSGQNMKNPKVGKAEILEGVIHFLKAEKGLQGAVAREKNPSSDGQHSYHDGMRSCLLRVRSFISSHNQELMESNSANPGTQEGQEAPLSLGQRHLVPVLTPPAEPSPALLHLQPQSFLTQLNSIQELHPTMAAPQHVSSAVWRPWPK